jgi:predicted RNase H-like nuclease
MSGRVAGVDGCRGRWVTVLWDGAGDSVADAHLLGSFPEVMAVDARVIAVDMPIGLPMRGGLGGRGCETEVRARIGERRSSVFAVPARAAVMETDYRQACAVSLLHSDPPRKVSKQTFMLFPYMREIDALMSPEVQVRVHEVHPELSFWAMNGGEPLALPKKVKGRPFEPGLALRRGLLSGAGFPLARLRLAPGAERAGRDDILDACAAAWSARRIRDGEHLRLPAEPDRDGKGLRMEINA